MRGKKRLGIICRLSDGTQVFLALRTPKHIFRDKEKSLSEAVQKNKARWGIELDTLDIIRRRGIQYAGIYCQNTGDKWLTAVDRFYRAPTARILKPFRGREQRTLPLPDFRFRQGVKNRI